MAQLDDIQFGWFKPIIILHACVLPLWFSYSAVCLQPREIVFEGLSFVYMRRCKGDSGKKNLRNLIKGVEPMNQWSLVRILYHWATCDKHPAYQLGLEFPKGEWRIFKPGKNVRIIFYQSVIATVSYISVIDSRKLRSWTERHVCLPQKRIKNNFLSCFWQSYIIDYRWLGKSEKRLAQKSKKLWNSSLLALTNVSH